MLRHIFAITFALLLSAQQSEERRLTLPEGEQQNRRTTQRNFVLKGRLANPEAVTRLGWESSSGQSAAITPAAEWEANVGLAAGENRISINVAFADGTIEQSNTTVFLEAPWTARATEAGPLVEVNGVETPTSIVGDDIILDGCFIIGQRSKAKNGRNAFVALPTVAPRWTNNTVFYVLDSTLTEAQRVTLRRGMDYWEANSPIRFRERTNEGSFVRALRLTPDEGACFATGGMPAVGTEGTLRLAESCSLGTIIHELGHTIGLLHTQQRPDRGRHVQIDFSNMDAGDRLQSRPLAASGSAFGAYDPGSIMHYRAFSFAKADNPPLSTTPRGISLSSDEASSNDLHSVRRTYGQTINEVVITSNPPGLRMDVDGESIITPRSYTWAIGTTHTLSAPASQGSGDLQMRFARWSNDGQRAQTVTINDNERVYSAHQIRFCRISLGVPNPIVGGAYTIAPWSPDDFYPCDSEVTLRATPAEGYTFLRWNYLNMGGVNPLTMRVDRAYSVASPIRPVFSNGPVLTVNSNPPGRFVTVNDQTWRAPVGFEFPEDRRYTLNAATQNVRRARFRFVDWSNAGAASQAVTSSGASLALTANFRPQHELFTSSVGTVGSAVRVQPNSGDNYFDDGTTLSLTAVPGTGGTFRGWGGDLSGTQSALTHFIRDQTHAHGSFLGSSGPQITAQSATSVAAGSPGFQLHLAGLFIGDGWTQFRVNGQLRGDARIFQSNNVQIPITAADVATPGVLRVQGTNPGQTDTPTSGININIVAGTDCNLTLGETSQSVGASGGIVQTRVGTGPGCGWNPVSSASWLELVPPASSGGPGVMSAWASINPSSTARTATIRIGTREFLVTQEGNACRAYFQFPEAALAATNTRFTAGVGIHQAGCVWSPQTDSDWFTVSANVSEGTGVLTILTTPNESGALRSGTVRLLDQTLRVQQLPLFAFDAESAVLNAASFAPGPFAPGSRVLVRGSGFTAETVFRLGELRMPVLRVEAKLAELQVPAAAAPGEAAVNAATPAGHLISVPVTLAATAPGLYRMEDGKVLLSAEDGSPIASAAPGSVVILRVTGQGVTDPVVNDGEPSPAGARPLAPVSVTVGGMVAEVIAAELRVGEVGMLNITVRIPMLEPGDRDVLVQVGEVFSNSAPLTLAAP
jgi:uncharacterized protein (TIGR03437 family)